MTKQTHSEVADAAIKQAIRMLDYEARLLDAGAAGRIPGRALPPGFPAAPPRG